MTGEDYPDGYGGAESPAGGIEYQLSYSQTMGTPAPDPDPQEQPSAPLSNVEAEAAFLGGIMIRNDVIPLVIERVSPDDFYEPLHGRIFRAIVRLHDKGRNANPVLLRPIFDNDPDMKEVGGVAYLAQLTGSGVALIGLHDFADQIAELAVRRNAVAAYREGIERLSAVDDGDDGIDAVDDIVSATSDNAALSLTRAVSLKPRSSAFALGRVIERQTEIEDRGAPVGAACKSITDLDKILGYAEPGTYNVLGGRPGMCKTTLACSAAWGYAASGAPTAYFHAEMTADQMDMRHAADLSHAMGNAVRHDRIRRGELTPAELRYLTEAQEMADTLPLDFIETKQVDIRRVEAAVARLALKWKNKGRKLGVVFIDYIQKYSATDARGRYVTDATEAAGIVSSTCARIAQRFEVAVFALAQLSRAVDDRKDHRPQMQDLKQTGKIEEDADSVTLLYRPEYYLAKEKPKKDPMSKEYLDWDTEMKCVEGQIELIGEKNRHGPGRTRTVRFIGPQYAVRSGDFNEMDSALLAPDLFADD